MRDIDAQDYSESSISDLCIQRSGRCDMVFLKLNDKSYEMVSKITEIKHSQIFNKLWKEYGKKLKDEVVTMEIIFNKIWSRICEKLKSINKKFLDGEMQLKKVDKYLDMLNKTDYNALEEEFKLLSRYFTCPTQLDEVTKKLGISIEKVKSYRQLFDAWQAAQAIQELQKVMDLQGNFSEVENIKEVRLYTFCCITVPPGQVFCKIFGLSQL